MMEYENKVSPDVLSLPHIHHALLSSHQHVQTIRLGLLGSWVGKDEISIHHTVMLVSLGSWAVETSMLPS